MIRSIPLYTFCALLASAHVFGQSTASPSSIVKLNLRKLNFLGSVLYVAAHPDDENTRIIAYLSNGRMADTGYLSITRGDGGQNLIGSEIRDPLGLVRTQELMTARHLDKGHQFFTRASDFGYSKNAEETFRVWGKQDILSDMVKVIRKFRPDVIITRFPPDSRAGHGHHVASAMLAKEAFHLSNDPQAFPDQVQEFGLWQPKSLYTNTGRWWNSSINKGTPGIVVMDVGGYSPLLGMSYPEIAAKSRTQHKSQGFGTAGRRGEMLEFLEYEAGDRAKSDIFEHVDTTWSRVVGGGSIQPLITRLIDDFDEGNPSASVSLLLDVHKKISTLENSIWRERKLKMVTELIKECLGLYVEVSADRYYAPPTEVIQCNFELVNRSAVPVVVRRISSIELSFDSTLTATLPDNTPLTFTSQKQLNSTLGYSSPYWLKEKHPLGQFTILDKALVGTPENKPSVTYTFEFEIGGEPISLTTSLVYKWVDPVKGELRRPFGVVPQLAVRLSDPVIIFNDDKGKDVDVEIKSYSETKIEGKLKLDLPPHWKSEPPYVSFVLPKVEDEKTITFMVYPSDEEIVSSLRAVAEVGQHTYSQSLQVIAYDHIPTQTLVSPSTAKVARVNLKTKGKRVGYIKGAGDKIPDALRSMGYEVWEMANDDVVQKNLAQLDAVVLGIRALNTNDRIPFFMDVLLDYVHGGGTLIVQYNTSRRLKVDADIFSPYPLSLSRVRVTDENSKVSIIEPKHTVFNFPNKITLADFEDWVQERGLYFPNEWDSHFKPLLSLHDPGEPDAKGSLLVAQYGKGHYVYTGLSFFRQLPAGVPGAYKLFANLVSMGESSK